MNLELKDGTYNFLNALVRVILPGLGALYFALDSIWGLPYAIEIIGTITAVSVFGGLVIELARKGWTIEPPEPAEPDEELIIDDRQPGETSFGFDSGLAFEDLVDGQVMTLKVRKVGENGYEAFEEGSA